MTILSLDFNAGKYCIHFNSIIFSIIFEEGNWVLKDGDGAKLSTNGTWLFVDELFKIYD